MILTTHILGAAALTQPIVGIHPVLLFFAAVASHYFLDAIPHRDYDLNALLREGDERKGKIVGVDHRKVVGDIIKVFIDGVLGVLILFFILSPALNLRELFPFALIVIGAVLPDMLQLVFWFLPRWPITLFHRFHRLVHTRHEPRRLIGFSIQGVIILFSLFLLVI